MRKWTIALVGVVLVGLVAAVAAAHAPENRNQFFQARGDVNDFPFNNLVICSEGLARITHGNFGYGFARSNTRSLGFEPFSTDCEAPRAQPEGQIRARYIYLKRTSVRPLIFGFCDTGGRDNPETDFLVEVFRNYGKVNPRPPCGTGNYKVRGRHATLEKGTWRSCTCTETSQHFFGRDPVSRLRPRDAAEVEASLTPALDEPLEVLGPNGQPIRCADGELLYTTLNQAGALPPGAAQRDQRVPSPEGTAVYEITDPAVPRCGPAGGGRSAAPTWVPESVGRDRAEAPPGTGFVPGKDQQ